MKCKMIKRCIRLFLIVAVCFFAAMPTMAADSYKTYIKKTLKQELGVAKTNKVLSSKRSPDSYCGGKGWCDTKGMITAYEQDFNGDGKNELLVLYLRKKYQNKQAYKSLRMAIYAEKDGEIVKCHDIALDNFIDMVFGRYTSVFLHKYKGETDIVLQSCGHGQGVYIDWWVLSVDRNNRFYVKTAVRDPGYTTGVGLYRYASTYDAGELADADYYHTGTKLYESNYNDSKRGKNGSAYKKALKKELKKYGLSVSKKSMVMGGSAKTVFMQIRKTSKCKMLCEIRASSKESYTNGKSTCRYTYRIINHIKNFNK